jgi:hypothetical protein
MSSITKWTPAKILRFSLFIIGSLFASLAWFLDNALEMEPVLQIIAPKYLVVKDALDKLDSNEASKISVDLEGSKILLKWWNPQPPKDMLKKVTFIGRSTGIFNIITGKHRYELRLLTEKDRDMYIGPPYVWVDYEAKELMQKELNSGLIKWKAWVFFIGILISIVSGAWEFLKKDAEPTARADAGSNALI